MPADIQSVRHVNLPFTGLSVTWSLRLFQSADFPPSLHPSIPPSLLPSPLSVPEKPVPDKATWKSPRHLLTLLLDIQKEDEWERVCSLSPSLKRPVGVKAVRAGNVYTVCTAGTWGKNVDPFPLVIQEVCIVKLHLKIPWVKFWFCWSHWALRH